MTRTAQSRCVLRSGLGSDRFYTDSLIGNIVAFSVLSSRAMHELGSQVEYLVSLGGSGVLTGFVSNDGLSPCCCAHLGWFHEATPLNGLLI